MGAFRVKRVDGLVLVVISGEIDVVIQQQLVDALQQAGAATPGHVVADMSNVEYMDSSGLAALLEAHQLLGDRFVVRNPSQAVRRVIEIAGVDEVLL